MVLTLEILTAGAGMVEAGTRQVFQPDGGTIGRRPDSTWVLPDSAVSSVHARITCRDGVFSVTDDHSTNGVFVNSEQELERGVPRELRSGDTVYIGPYEIGVTIPSDDGVDDPFAAASLHVPAPARRPALERADGPQPLAELDPLKALELKRKPDRVDAVPEESHLHARSPLEDHYRPRVPQAPAPPTPTPATPPPRKTPAAPAATPPLIPDDYDPLASEAPSDEAVDPVDVLLEAGLDEDDPFAEPLLAPPAAVGSRPPVSASPPAVASPPPIAPPPSASVSQPALVDRPAAAPSGDDAATVASILEGAGLPGAVVTPEVARAFGRILRVVVEGVMDIDRTRQDFKHEFRLEYTRMHRVGNNPLKYSANVDDALHNVFVKRSDAYMGPVEAFEEVFEDLRRHQVAVLAGIRAAFESMLAEFDPSQIQAEVDQRGKGPLPKVLPKGSYWDRFCEKSEDVASDREQAFRKLFGEALADAYEEQVEQLRQPRGQ